MSRRPRGFADFCRAGAVGLTAAAACFLSLAIGAAAPAAAEAPPPLLWQTCEPGSGAAQCTNPRGLAADAESGHVFVSDQTNDRVVELSAWGEFVRAWGWGVVDGESEELQVCTEETGCKAGLGESGAGAVDAPQGIALDSAGDVYVVEFSNRRVQKFSPEGEFELMFGGEVNKTTTANVCTKADLEGGEECGAGVEGSEPGFFGSWPVGSFIAIDPEDNVYVGDQGRIQRFDAEGAYQGEIEVPGERVRGLAADGEGNLLAAFAETGESTESKPEVRKLGPGGEALCESSGVAFPNAVAADGEGGFYVVDGGNFVGEGPATVRKFGPSCSEDTEFGFGAGEVVGSTGIAVSGACGVEGNAVYVAGRGTGGSNSLVRSYSPSIPDPEECPPPEAPPEIDAQFASAVGVKSATVHAEINPRFWSGGGAVGVTTYQVQYATEACVEAGGWEAACVSVAPASPAALGVDPVNEAVRTDGVLLSGLSAETAYRYRFAAEGSVIGEEVIGEGGKPGEPGAEAAFTTYPPLLPAKGDCPNQAFRGGVGARLPDCRAYEMVSPVDKEGGDLVPLINSVGVPVGLDQAASGGDAATYSSHRALADAQGAPYTSQYLARRGEGGWQTEAISPPQVGPTFLEAPEHLDSNYKGFSEDLCHGWVLQNTEPALSAGALRGLSNLYRRDSCAGAGSFGALITTADEPMEAVEAKNFLPAMQGFTEDASHAVFRAPGRLTANASAARQLYELHGGGALRLVCVLPGEVPSAEACSAGTNLPGSEGRYRRDSVWNAVSADGERIFWSEDESGGLYVRIGGEETRQISAAGDAHYWGAAADGARAVYSTGNFASAGGGEATLRVFEVDGKEDEAIAGEAFGVMGMSEDARRIYFASKEVLSTEANSKGDTAVEGQPNLYLHDAAGEGSYAFVGTLAAGDVGSNVRPSPLQRQPESRSSRVSADGRHAAFNSAARLTGRVNADAASGEPNAQVFIYEAGPGELRCASCNASGARPRGRELEWQGSSSGLWAAGVIPGWSSQFSASRVLAEDGSRLFFESTDPLVLSDTNNRRDVYEWQPGDSKGDCVAAGAELHLAAEGGCLSLITSGQSPSDSELVDASADGRDVFFKTASSLVGGDPDLYDLYDAREGGGFPAPEPPDAPCEGEACQSPAPAPRAETPSSSTFSGPGNPPLLRNCRALARRTKARSTRAKALRRRYPRLARRAGASARPAVRRKLRRRALRMRRVSVANAKAARRLAKRTRACRRANMRRLG